MPTITYYRMWCKGCNDFTLHFHDDKCTNYHNCGTVYSDVYLSEIPKDKIIEQRQRYKASRLKKSPITTFLKMASPSNPFNTEFPKQEIVESDAGLKSIEEERRKEIEEELKKNEELKQESLKYNKLGRNDTCLCGSGKKYKNCHLLKFNQIK